MDVTIHSKTCTHCGHIWLPRKPTRPVQCPNCKSQTWDKPRSGEVVSVSEGKGEIVNPPSLTLPEED